MMKKAPAKKEESPGEDEGLFALRSMRLPPETKHRFITAYYDKLASSFGMPTGKEAAAAALAKVKEIAGRHYGEAMRTWGTADQSSSSTFFSKEGDPTYICVNFQHKLEMLTVKTYGIPEALHQEIEKALGKQENG